MKNLLSRIDDLSNKFDNLVRDSELWYASFYNSPFATAIFDSNFKFMFVNEEFMSLTRYDKSIIGKHLHTVIPLNERENHKIREKEFLANPKSRLGNMGLSPKILTKDKQEILVEISLAYVIIEGQSFFICYIRLLKSLYESIGENGQAK